MIKARITHSPDNFGYDVFLYYEHPDGKHEIVTALGPIWELKAMVPGDRIEPTFSTGREQHLMQVLVDAFYDCGIKPKEAPPLENELTAVRGHLQDMRKLVFTSGLTRMEDEKQEKT